jgi:hypothetical protein
MATEVDSNIYAITSCNIELLFDLIEAKKIKLSEDKKEKHDIKGGDILLVFIVDKKDKNILALECKVKSSSETEIVLDSVENFGVIDFLHLRKISKIDGLLKKLEDVCLGKIEIEDTKLKVNKITRKSYLVVKQKFNLSKEKIIELKNIIKRLKIKDKINMLKNTMVVLRHSTSLRYYVEKLPLLKFLLT